VPFITLEGIEGSGKSTLLPRLAAALGPDALATQEPGGTAIGRSVRALLLDPANHGMTARAELLLYFADRAQHVAEVVRPALALGRVVLCDRYVDSTLAYQGYGRGLPLDAIRAVAEVATGGLTPDLTLLLDVDVETGLARAGRRGAHDRLEAESVAFHERVRVGYQELARSEPRRWRIVDARGDHDGVYERVWATLQAAGKVGRASVP
jgi:dTMP kinase